MNMLGTFNEHGWNTQRTFIEHIANIQRKCVKLGENMQRTFYEHTANIL